MARKNIFQLVEENYNIQEEIIKINKLFFNKDYFENCFNEEYRYGYSGYSFKRLLNNYLFMDWKYRGTCMSLDEYFKRVSAHISNEKENSESIIINNLEVMENFIKLFSDNEDELLNEHAIQCTDDFKSVFCKLINTLEKKMGLIAHEYEDKIILCPKDAPLEQVIQLCDDEDVQWELIRYVRENLSLAEKRKTLAYLATNLYIEEDCTEKEEPIKSLVKQSTNILNNLQIRHNNRTGKWENKVLENLDENEALSLCDMLYNEMLIIVLLRRNKKYEEIYDDFNKKQKEEKLRKQEGKKINGQAENANSK